MNKDASSPDVLWDGIRSALKGKKATSEDLQILLDRTNDQADAVSAQLADATSRAVDPFASDAESEAAHAECPNLDWNLQRLKNAIVMLEDQHKKALSREDSEKKLARYKEVESKRYLVAERIKAQYPKIQESLMSMIQDIIAVSKEIDDVNASLPDGCRKLDRPEGFAFGVPDGGEKGVLEDREGEFNRISRMVIPDYKNPMVAAWPPAYNRLAEKMPRLEDFIAQVRYKH